MFWECKYVQNIWLWISQKLGITIHNQNIALNNIGNNPRSYVNTLVLFVKYYIHSSKCKDEKISVTNVKIFIQNQIAIEEHIAKNKQKLSQHLLKWSDYK